MHGQFDFDFKEIVYQGLNVFVPISPYEYLALDDLDDAFRLLEVLPARDFSAPIECKLVCHRLSENPFYTALSYECGDPSKYHIIQVDEVAFPVTLNLEAALRQLRDRGCPLLWVDAICTHQTNNNEKNAPIQLMKDFYNRAESVAVWLGTESNGSRDVMQMIRAIDPSRKANGVAQAKPWTPGKYQLEDIS
jgi:hypothetical protein